MFLKFINYFKRFFLILGVLVLIHSSLVPHLTRERRSIFICASCILQRIKAGNKISLTPYVYFFAVYNG